MTECETNLQVPKENGISFSGSFSAKFVELFSGSIAKHVTSALNLEICPKVQEMVDYNLTGVIREIDLVLEDLIDDFTEEDDYVDVDVDVGIVNVDELKSNGILISPLSAKDIDLLQWKELSVLKSALIQMSSFVNGHLDKGILLNLLDKIGWGFDSNSHSRGGGGGGGGNDASCIDCGYFFRGVNGLIRSMTNDGDGQVTIGIHRDIDVVVSMLGNVTISLHNVTISGLDQFTQLGLYPNVNHDLSPQAMMKGLGLSLAVDLKVDTNPDGIIHGKQLDESFNVVVNISNVDLAVDMDVGVVREGLRNITIGDLSSPLHRWKKVLLGSVSHVILSNVLTTVALDTIEVDPVNTSDTLERSLDGMVNNVIDLVLSEYSALVTKSLEAAADGPVRVLLNKILANLTNPSDLSDDFYAEEDGSAGASQFYRFNESIAIRRMHDFFARDKVVNKMNAFVACISSFIKANPLRSSPLVGSGISAVVQNFAFEDVHVDGVGELILILLGRVFVCARTV